MGYQALGKLVASRHALPADDGAARIHGIRKNEATALQGDGFQFGFAGSTNPYKTRRPARKSCFGPRTRHSSACVPQNNPSIAQRSATHASGRKSVTWACCVLIGEYKQGWSYAPAVKLSEAVAERGRWRAASRAVPSSGEADRDQGEMSDFPHQVQVGLVEDGSLTSVNTLPRLVRASATNPSDATVTATGLPSITW